MLCYAIQVVTELRNRHAAGETAAGINVRKGKVTNILEENVVVPLLPPHNPSTSPQPEHLPPTPRLSSHAVSSHAVSSHAVSSPAVS
jgi:hypothetical protein